MRVESKSETISTEQSAVQIAFDLAGSDASYLILSVPADMKGDEQQFFGYDHYVEVKDQLFGRYGGLKSLNIAGEQLLLIELSYDVPDVGRSLAVVTHEPMQEELRERLRRLERV